VYQVAAVCLKGGGVVVFCPCWSKVLREVVTLGGYRMPLFYLLGGLAKVWREVVPLGLLSYSIGGLCVAGRYDTHRGKPLWLSINNFLTVVLIFVVVN
jgi:hypothetical protein